MKPLRQWQQLALQRYERLLLQGAKSCLWEATPGAGKTTAALHLCLDQLRRLDRRYVVVVVPTTHLKNQWARAAHRLGVELDANFNGFLSRDYDGLVVTYHQVARNPAAYPALARRAVVVLDEVHHAAEGLTWGEALMAAFKHAPFVLALSGTPFRSDNATIPFVEYVHGASQPDYQYGYRQAVADGICRPVAFFTYGGEMSWQEGEMTFEDNFNEASSQRGKLLRVALHPEGKWVRTMLVDAHEMLCETRREHPTAGGLLVAIDQEHARALAGVLMEITGQAPVVALSDDEQAGKKIRAFTEGRAPWIVACNMVSEGVDIPRLRVGVYATTTATRMYFRQFVGRMVRVTPEPVDVQVAYVYLPAEATLKFMAGEIEEEQRHLVYRRPVAERTAVSLPNEYQRNELVPLNAKNSGLEAVIASGRQLSLFGFGDQSHSEVRQSVQAHFAQPEREPLARFERKEALAQEIKGLVGRYHHRTGEAFHHIYARLNRHQRVRNQELCTEEQLTQRCLLLRRWLR